MNVIVKFSFMEEWKSIRLGDIVRIGSGLAYKADHLGSGDALLLGMGCVSFNEKFLKKGARLYSGTSEERYIVSPGDIVLATRQQSDNLPILGMPAIIPEDYQGKRLIAGSNLYIVHNQSDIDNRFLYWLLKTPGYINHISSCKTGTTVRMITKKDVESFVFKCPPKEERERIADFLWSIEDKIDLNNRINHNLEEQADCLISSAIETQSIGSAHLWDICSYVTERVNNDTLNNKNYISTDNMFANKGGIGIASTIPDGKCTSFKVRDVLVSNIRPYFKKIWRASFSGGCSNDVLCFRTTKGTSSFLYHLLRSDVFFDYVMSGAKGSKMPRGDKQHIMNWTIPVFEKAIIISLEDSLEVIDDRVAIIQEENRRLSAIRDSLLPMLMTNSIYINDLTC